MSEPSTTNDSSSLSEPMVMKSPKAPFCTTQIADPFEGEPTEEEMLEAARVCFLALREIYGTEPMERSEPLAVIEPAQMIKTDVVSEPTKKSEPASKIEP